MNNFELNGVLIKNPSTFKIERYRITTLNRLANGKMVGDFIARKHKFFFTYAAITSRELNNILDLIWETDSIFYTLKYVENGVSKTAQVYAGAIPTELHRAEPSANWVWKNVNFNLIEQ
jgi:hypothetical protein